MHFLFSAAQFLDIVLVKLGLTQELKIARRDAKAAEERVEIRNNVHRTRQAMDLSMPHLCASAFSA